MKSQILAMILFTSIPALAGERYEYFNGIRGMAMGGTSVATVNDETALISNPAGLGRLRDFFITVVDPEIEVGAETEQIVKTQLTKGSDPQFILDKTNLMPDKHFHTRAQIFPSIVVPNFGIGVFAKTVTDAHVDSETEKFVYDYTQDYAIVAGLNFRFWNGIIKIGTNARITNRTEVHRDDIDTDSTDLTLKELASSGIGVGSDAGLIITLPIAALPALAAVYRDVGNTSYSLRDGMTMKTEEKPVHTQGTLDGAISFQPMLGRVVRSTWTAELQDVMNVKEEKDMFRRAHVGVEVNFADAFFLRAGMNQRYWTAGFELSMFNYQFQVASYGEDIGPDESPREDRRYEAKFAFRF